MKRQDIEGAILGMAAVLFIIWLMWGINYGQRKYEKKGDIERGVAVVQARLAIKTDRESHSSLAQSN